MKNKFEVVGTIIQFGALAMFASSFFVKDNSKAVRRRWISLGVGAAGYAIQIAPKLMAKK